MAEPIYHEFREIQGFLYHRLVQGSERGKWVRSSEFASIGTRLYAAPTGESLMPEVFEVNPVWATTINSVKK